MSALTVTCSRTVGHARNLFSTALAVGGFLAVSSALVAFALEESEGVRMSFASIWSVAVARVLPFLCAVISGDTWSEERRTGRVESLLSLAIREREFVLGKFFGGFLIALGAVVLSLAVNLVSLFFLAPSALDGVTLVGLLPALTILAMQCALYVSACVAVSAFFTNAAAAVAAAVAVVWAIPQGVWQAIVAWFPSGSGTFGEFPLEAHAADIAGGSISVAVVVFYALAVLTALFVAAKAVFALRFRGRGAKGGRFSTAVVILLALAVAALMTVLVSRLDATLDLPLNGGTEVSERTRKILSESRGDIIATCFVPRSDREFRSVAMLLRSLARESSALGGTRIRVDYVDPRWDLGKSGRLVREGVVAPAIVFSNRRRRVTLPLADGWGERACASAIQRLTVPPSRNAVYWTFGHGEASLSDYGPAGMSDIARELARDGYRNFALDLASEASIPADCALIAIAGARRDFSRAETMRLEAFLRQGGRLLVLAEGPESALLSTLVPTWGAIVKGVAAKPPRTLSGTDSVISDFGVHPVAAPLKGSQIVLEKPVLFAPSAAAGFSTEADRIEYSSLADTESLSAAVMLERGSAAGRDTAIRPTRIAVIGDAAFVRNAQLSSRANANRDFFLNCIAYLSGSHAIAAGGAEDGLLVSGLDRQGHIRLLTVSAAAIPAAVALVMLLVAWRRRVRQ